MLGEKSSLLANFIPISQHFSIIKLADSLVLISTCLLCLASFVKHLYIKKSVFFSSSHASGRASEWRRLRRVRDAHRAHSKRQDSSQIRAAGNGAQAKCWRWSRKKKSVLRSENAVEIEFSWFRVGEKRRNCFQSNSFRLSTRRREKEMWIWNFYAMHFDLLYDASPTRKKVRTRGDEFVQFSSRCCRSCRPLESVFLLKIVEISCA